MSAAASLALTVTPSLRVDRAAALAYWRTNGFLVEPNLVTDHVLDKLLAMALARDNAADGTFRPVPMPHREDPLFLEIMRYPPIVAIVETLLGGTASGLGGEFFYMKPGTRGFVEHQDNAYVQAPPDAFLSAWSALVDVDAENGGMVFYPGSHKLGHLATHELGATPDPGQNPGAQAVTCGVPEGFAPLALTVRKGSTVFFHSQLVHASNDNCSRDRFRHSFLATYLLKGQPFRPGRAQKRSEVELHGE